MCIDRILSNGVVLTTIPELLQDTSFRTIQFELREYISISGMPETQVSDTLRCLEIDTEICSRKSLSKLGLTRMERCVEFIEHLAFKEAFYLSTNEQKLYREAKIAFLLAQDDDLC